MLTFRNQKFIIRKIGEIRWSFHMRCSPWRKNPSGFIFSFFAVHIVDLLERPVRSYMQIPVKPISNKGIKIIRNHSIFLIGFFLFSLLLPTRLGKIMSTFVHTTLLALTGTLTEGRIWINFVRSPSDNQKGRFVICALNTTYRDS